MRFKVGQYVRFWDGSAITYGQVKADLNPNYRVRVGGTDAEVVVEPDRMTLHPASVASGMLLEEWVGFKRNPGDKYLYHVSAQENVKSIMAQGGLRSRSGIDWSKLGGDVYTGSEVADGRATSVGVDIAAFLRDEAKTDHGQLGDVGEFFYATMRTDKVWGYLGKASQAKKKPIVYRFKAPKHTAWYEDIRTGALMTMSAIPLTACEVLPISSSKLARAVGGDFLLEDEIMNTVEEKKKGWISCGDHGWDEFLALEMKFL